MVVSLIEQVELLVIAGASDDPGRTNVTPFPKPSDLGAARRRRRHAAHHRRESDICFLAAVLGALDRSHRIVLVTDALGGSIDETYDASMQLYPNRLQQQPEAVTTAAVLEALTTALAATMAR